MTQEWGQEARGEGQGGLLFGSFILANGYNIPCPWTQKGPSVIFLNWGRSKISNSRDFSFLLKTPQNIIPYVHLCTGSEDTVSVSLIIDNFVNNDVEDIWIKIYASFLLIFVLA